MIAPSPFPSLLQSVKRWFWCPRRREEKVSPAPFLHQHSHTQLTMTLVSRQIKRREREENHNWIGVCFVQVWRACVTLNGLGRWFMFFFSHSPFTLTTTYFPLKILVALKRKEGRAPPFTRVISLFSFNSTHTHWQGRRRRENWKKRWRQDEVGIIARDRSPSFFSLTTGVLPLLSLSPSFSPQRHPSILPIYDWQTCFISQSPPQSVL